MPIKAVTYYEAWCEAGEQLELGEFTAYADKDSTSECVTDGDGVVLADGRVYCHMHKPAEVCPDTDDNKHSMSDGECSACGHELPVEEVPS